MPLRGLPAGSVDLVTSPGEDLDFSCMSRAFRPALDRVVRAGNENTRRAGARQDSHVNDAGAVPTRNRVLMSPCVAQRYWYPAMTPLGGACGVTPIWEHLLAEPTPCSSCVKRRRPDRRGSQRLFTSRSHDDARGTRTTCWARDTINTQATPANVRSEFDRGGLRRSEIYSGETL